MRPSSFTTQILIPPSWLSLARRAYNGLATNLGFNALFAKIWLQKPTKRGWNSKSLHTWLNMQLSISRLGNSMYPIKLKFFLYLCVHIFQIIEFAFVFYLIRLVKYLTL